MYAKTTWVNASAPCLSIDNLNNLESQYSNIIQVGEIKLYAGTTAPDNYLICSGTSKDKNQYSALFAYLGYTFGGGGQWFNLPNLQGKFVVGYKIATEYSTMGGYIGSSDVTLTTAQIPAHLHNIYYGGSVLGSHDLGNNSSPFDPAPWQYVMTNTDVDGGSDNPHSNLPQYITLNYIIRYR
jgi:microcystin-dependent protein